MPVFETPEPIIATVEIGVGDVQVVASDRTDTVVEVRPSNPDKKGDVNAAAQTRVEYANGRLQVKTPKSWRQYASFRGGESVDVLVELPAGSRIEAETGVAAVRCTGPLGPCNVKVGVGEIRIEEARPARLNTGAGDITLDRSVGQTEVTTGTGALHIGAIDGKGMVKNANGATWIGEATGDLQVSGGNGAITIDRARADVSANGAHGEIRIGEVTRGSVVARTAMGPIDIGVRDGVPAWLDVETHFGVVRNGLDSAARPGPGEDAVEVRARTAFGDITINRRFSDDTSSGIQDAR